MFPTISVSPEDTLSALESRLAKAIITNAKQPGIKPVYTWRDIKEEAARLYGSIQSRTFDSVT